MNAIFKAEYAGNMLGVSGRYFNVIRDDSTGIIRNQTFKAAREYAVGKDKYRIVVEVRFDDECKNGHESFAITADIRENGREYMGGCCHDEIVQRFPELEPLIKWHLTSTDGPMHYIANTIYHAGDRDCDGLREGETKQIRNGRTGEPCWILTTHNAPASKYHDGEKPPADTPTMSWEPWLKVGKGKARELDYARSSAVWPDATDAELMQDAPALKAALLARHPALMAEFKAAMIAAGFVWPSHVEAIAA